MKAMEDQYMKIEGLELSEGSGLNVNIDINDIIFFLGLGLVTTGLWIYEPAVSLTVTGVIFMWAAYSRAGGDNN